MFNLNRFFKNKYNKKNNTNGIINIRKLSFKLAEKNLVVISEIEMTITPEAKTLNLYFGKPCEFFDLISNRLPIKASKGI